MTAMKTMENKALKLFKKYPKRNFRVETLLKHFSSREIYNLVEDKTIQFTKNWGLKLNGK